MAPYQRSHRHRAVYLFDTRDYLGLGVWSPDSAAPTIARFFLPGADHRGWALKIIFTVVTLSFGYKGGEVTRLVFIGAALGHTIGGVLGAPVGLFAGLGFIAAFAGAANTQPACTIMSIELFGATDAVYLATACFVAYLRSGHSSIYPAVHRLLMNERRPLDEEVLREAVERLGGSWTKIQQDLRDHATQIQQQLSRNENDAYTLGVAGTLAYTCHRSNARCVRTQGLGYSKYS